MSTTKSLLTALIATSGLAIVALSFFPWFHFELSGIIGCFGYCDPSDIRGTDVQGVTPFGDGYLVAVLGTVMLGLTIGTATSKRRPHLALALAAAGLTTMAIAGYDLLNESDATANWSQEPAVALYAEMALAISVALCAAILLGLQQRSRGIEPPDGESVR